MLLGLSDGTLYSMSWKGEVIYNSGLNNFGHCIVIGIWQYPAMYTIIFYFFLTILL